MPTVDEVFSGLRLLAVERAQLNVQHFTGRFCGLHHRHTVGISAGDGLLAVDVLARLQRRHGDGHVQVVVQAHVHRHEVIALQQLTEVRVRVGDAELRRYTAQFRRVEVRCRHDFNVLNFLIIPQVTLANLPYTDNSDTNLIFTHS